MTAPMQVPSTRNQAEAQVSRRVAWSTTIPEELEPAPDEAAWEGTYADGRKSKQVKRKKKWYLYRLWNARSGR